MNSVERASQLVSNEYYFISGAGVVLFLGQIGSGPSSSFVFRTVRKKFEIKLRHNNISDGIVKHLPGINEIEAFFKTFSRDSNLSDDFIKNELTRYHDLSACLHGAGLLKIANTLRDMVDFMMKTKNTSTSLSNMDTRMLYELANLSRELIVYSRDARQRHIDKIHEMTSFAA